MIQYIIVDDEPIAHNVIKEYCNQLSTLTFKKSCYDALDALDYLSKHSVDLIFLDINMPKLKGFDFLRTLRVSPKIVVTTAYSEFALEGYELNVSDYLLKPFSFERFLKAINKVIDSDKNKSYSVLQQKALDIETRIFLRKDKKHIQLLVEEILFFESFGNYVKVITRNETIIVRDKISALLESLPKDLFLQVHKSYAIAVKHINSIEGNRISIGEHIVPIGKLYKLNVDRLLG
jgi:DNA-binding LytR/AlgR family response regulator